MTAITAALVKQLRDRSGAGMMDCKKALVETAGDMEAAVDWLRTRGLAAAAKKAGRVAAEGLVATAVSEDGRRGAVVEINAETDFVARNGTFQDFVRHTATLALDSHGDVDALARTTWPGSSGTVQDRLTDLVATIGENLQIRRSHALGVTQGTVAHYVHTAAAPGMGRIAVIVALESAGDRDVLRDAGRKLAMHIAASRPESVTTEALDPALVERERGVLTEQARESGKPEAIVERMVEGRLRKFFQDVVLMEQVYVIDGESRVAKVMEDLARDLGTAVEVAGFVRYGLGEGIEKKESDFAAEVAAAASGG